MDIEELKVAIDELTFRTYNRIVIYYKNQPLTYNADEYQIRAIMLLVAEKKINNKDLIIKEYLIGKLNYIY